MNIPITHALAESPEPDSASVAAIDIHGHYGNYLRAEGKDLVDGFMSASAAEVAARAQACGVEWTVVSPMAGLFPRYQADTAGGNEAAWKEVPPVRGLLQYVIVNPRQPATYEQARRMYKSGSCVGIKIHPEEHGYRISDQGGPMFEFFEELQAPVLTHSGCPNSLPAEFVPFADRHPTVKLLLAHLGNGAGAKDRADLQVRAIQAARHGNIWVDTSSARSIMAGLIEWAVGEVGAERLLFGSDTPLYHVGAQRARIDRAEIPAAAKRLILRENAIEFLSCPAIFNNPRQ